MICNLESAFSQRREREQLGGPLSRMGLDSWAESVPGSERALHRALADRVGCRWEACMPDVPSLPGRSPEPPPQLVPPACPARSGVGRVPGARPSPVCWSLPQRTALFKSMLRVWK